jgi:hypothetical protein
MRMAFAAGTTIESGLCESPNVDKLGDLGIPRSGASVTVPLSQDAQTLWQSVERHFLNAPMESVSPRHGLWSILRIDANRLAVFAHHGVTVDLLDA